MKKISLYIDLFRVRYSSYPPAAAISGAILAQYRLGQWDWWIVLISALIILLLWWGGMVTNHIFDIDIDREAINLAQDKKMDVNAVRENHPLAAGTLSMKEALIVSLMVYATAFALAYSINLQCLGLALAICLGTQFYNKTIKHRSLSGSLFFAILISQCFTMGALASGVMTATHYFIVSSTILYHTGVHIFGSIKDYDSDLHVGSGTFPVRMGIKRSSIIAIIFIISGYMVAILPFVFKLLHASYLIFVVVSALIVMPKALKTYEKPIPSMGWKTLLANIAAGTILYISYSFGTIAFF